VEDINIPLSPGHPDKKKLELIDTTDQTDLIDIYTVFHPITTQYTFFSSAH
jgi:hypothetical protein